jgi:hypothetical protein
MFLPALADLAAAGEWVVLNESMVVERTTEPKRTGNLLLVGAFDRCYQ